MKTITRKTRETNVAIGLAIADLVSPRVARFAERTIPMDDALVNVVLDLGGRPYYCGALPSELYNHWMRSFADNARCTLHIRLLRGRDRHHIVEAAFKALGLALRSALREEHGDPLSMKGVPVVEDGSC